MFKTTRICSLILTMVMVFNLLPLQVLGVTQSIDTVSSDDVVTAAPSLESAEIVEEMNLKPGVMGLIINRAPGGVLDDGVKAEVEKHGLTLLGVLPQDGSVYRCDCDGEPSAKLPASNPVKIALKGIMANLGL